MAKDRRGGCRKLAARVVLDAFQDVVKGLDGPRGQEALEFAASEEFDWWCDALDRQPSDVRRMMGRIVGRGEGARAP